MKMHQIIYFLSIIDNGGIRAASRSINVSQSSIFKSLVDLERECGCQLLERKTNGGIKLTHTGELLEPYFRSIELNLSWAKLAVDKTKTGDFGTIRVGVTPIISSTVLPKVYQWFKCRFKNVQLQFIDGLLNNVTPLLKSAKLDYAIALIMDDWVWDKGHITVHELFKIPHGFIAKPEHPIFKDINKADSISNYDWLFTLDSFNEANDFISKCINPQGIAMPKSVILVDTFSCYSMLYNTESIAVAPSYLFKTAPGFKKMKTINLDKHNEKFKLPELKLVMLKSPSCPNSHAGEYLMHCFKSVIEREFTH